MDVGTALVADNETAEPGEPGECPLDHPAVTAQAAAVLDALAGDAGRDAAATEGTADRAAGVGLVRVELPGPPPWPAPLATADGRHGIQRCLQQPAVVLVGRGDDQAERRALGIGDEAVLAARPAAIRGVRAGRLAPLFAGTDRLSSAARSQRRRSAASSRSSRSRCSRAHTPAACQSRSRRQQVIPDPQPIFTGSRSHGEPVVSMNMIPVSAARSGKRGRLPFGLGRSTGSSGSIAAHRSSGTKTFAMPRTTRKNQFR